MQPALESARTAAPPRRRAVQTQFSTPWLNRLATFLIRRRIVLSAVVFGSLIGLDLARGVKPRDLTNFRDPVAMLGVVLVYVGLGLRSWAAGILKKNSELTTCGPYRLIRNPLYVGSFLMMFGFCTVLNDPWSYGVILGPILLVYAIKVRQEEQLLAGLFPAHWHGYKGSTPRFIPRLSRIELSSNWTVGQWVHAREYEALGASLLALAAMKVWQLMDFQPVIFG